MCVCVFLALCFVVYIIFTACQYHLHLVLSVASLDVMNRNCCHSSVVVMEKGKTSGQGTGKITNCSSQGACSHIL